MKKTFLAVVLVALSFAASAIFAQQATPPAGKSAQTKPTVPTPAEFDKSMAQMLEQMKIMQAQMEKMRQTQDPQARQKLLQEHWTSMQSAMGTMYGMGGPMMGRGMMGPSMMGGGHMMGPGMMGGPMMWGDYQNLTPEQLRHRQYMMNQYMGMQQMMMDHMMWHQHWMMPQTQPAPK